MTGHVLVDEGDRTVLELAGGIALGVDVGNLLELKRSFERHRIAAAATEVEHVTGMRQRLGQLRILAFVAQHGRDQPRHLDQSLDQLLLLLG